MRKQQATHTALLAGSQPVSEGRADVFHQRERARLKKLVRAVVIVAIVDFLLYRLWSSGFPLWMPHFGSESIFFIPPLVMLIAIIGMPLVMLMNGRSPHIIVYPEQVEVGLTDIKGLDNQVDEVMRSLDVFLGYATFREELGGTPATGHPVRGTARDGQDVPRQGDGQAGGGAVPVHPGAGVPIDVAGHVGVPDPLVLPQASEGWRARKGARSASSRRSTRWRGPEAGSAASPAPTDLSRTSNAFFGSGDSGNMVNELLIQMQSFDQPPWGRRMKAKMIIVDERLSAHGVADDADASGVLQHPADRGHQPRRLARPGAAAARDGSTAACTSTCPRGTERRELIDFFLVRKAHDDELDTEENRDRIAAETFAYTPVMIEHLFDEALLLALRDGRRAMSLRDVMEAKFNDEVGLKQTTAYTDFDREAVATHEAGHATVAYLVGTGRRLEVLSIIKRRDVARHARAQRRGGAADAHQVGDRERHRDRARRPGGRGDLPRRVGNRTRAPTSRTRPASRRRWSAPSAWRVR